MPSHSLQELSALDALVLTAAFLLELAALAAIGWWGFTAGGSAVAKVALGVGAPLLVAAMWGTFLSPKASVEIPAAAVVALKALVFGAAAVALLAVGETAPAELFAAAVVVDTALLYALRL